MKIKAALSGLLAKLRPAVVPALHTLWQSFAAIMAGWWVVSGTDALNQVHSISDVERFGTSAAIAAGAALLSAIKTTIRTLTKTKLPDPDLDVPAGVDPLATDPNTPGSSAPAPATTPAAAPPVVAPPMTGA